MKVAEETDSVVESAGAVDERTAVAVADASVAVAFLVEDFDVVWDCCWKEKAIQRYCRWKG